MTNVTNAARVLMVVTSHDQLGDTGRASGFHWEELTTPYWLFRDAGFEVEIASIRAGIAPQDPGSLNDDPAGRPDSVRRFMEDDGAMAALGSTPGIANQSSADFAAVFLAGGHGTMWDFPNSEPFAKFVGEMFDRGAVVGAVCHGPAGLVAAKRADGEPIVKDRRINSFTDDEERSIGSDRIVPFLLETRFRELGAAFEGGANFQPYAVRDGNLVTGQNPQSALLVAEHMLAALEEPRATNAAA